eukprot:5185264-Pyramimonas_sp.AAC.1
MAAKKGLGIHAVPDHIYKRHAELLDEVRQVAAWIGNGQAQLEARPADRGPTLGRRRRGAQGGRRGGSA